MKRIEAKEMPLRREIMLNYEGMALFLVMILQVIGSIYICIKNKYDFEIFMEMYMQMRWYYLFPPVGIVLSWIAEQYFLFVRYIFMTKGKRYDGKIVKRIMVKSDSGRLMKDRILVIEYDNGKRFKTPRYSVYEGYRLWGDRCSVYVLFGMRYATDYETRSMEEIYNYKHSKK